MNQQHTIDFLLRKTEKLEQDSRLYRDYIDTVSSPLRKRLWWYLGGYHFRKVGRWYSEKSLVFRVWHRIAVFIHCT